MSVAIITGSAGLIGAESVRFFSSKGLDVAGIDNNMRQVFFGHDASNRLEPPGTGGDRPRLSPLRGRHPRPRGNRDPLPAIRRRHPAGRSYRRPALARLGRAGPAHRFFGQRQRHPDPRSARQHCPDAVFIFTSTNKVYGDKPNSLPLVEQETRWEIDPAHPYAEHGIDESMSVDQTKHSFVRRVETGGRRDGPGIRTLFQHEDRLLSRRLLDRAGALRHDASWFPVLSGELRHVSDVHRLRLQGEASPR